MRHDQLRLAAFLPSEAEQAESLPLVQLRDPEPSGGTWETFRGEW